MPVGERLYGAPWRDHGFVDILRGVIQPEFRMALEKRGYLHRVFFRLGCAGAVHQDASGLHQPGALLEEAQLLADEAQDVLGLALPLDVRLLAKDPEAR